MDIVFSIGNVPAKLTRGWFFGGIKIVTPDEMVWVQHPLNPRTHFAIRLKQSWTQIVAGQPVTVEKIRPRWIAGARPQLVRVFVKDSLVAQANGY